MPILTLTYKQLSDLVVSYITSNCYNISRYSSMPSCFKSGYSESKTISSSGAGYTSSCTITISDYISSVSSSTVSSDMNSFLTSIGVTNPNALCTGKNFIGYINDLVSFCATKLAFATSQFSTSTYLIYNTSSSYSSKIEISGSEAERLAYATDATSILNSLVSVLKQNIRIKRCTYNVSFK